MGDVKKFGDWLGTSNIKKVDVSNLKMEPYEGAGEYGDSHPRDTKAIYGLSKRQAKYFEEIFKMKTMNAPDGYDVDKIEMEARKQSSLGLAYRTSQDMSVGIDDGDDEESDEFIYLTIDFYRNKSGEWNLIIGPKFIKKVEEVLSGNTPSLEGDNLIHSITDIILMNVEMRQVRFTDDMEIDPDSAEETAKEILKFLNKNGNKEI
jgi:hypothetical protein